MLSLKERFLRDNSGATDFQKMAVEFYFEVQELAAKDPQWAKDITELAKQMKKKREQFESPSHQACKESGNTQILEPK